MACSRNWISIRPPPVSMARCRRFYYIRETGNTSWKRHRCFAYSKLGMLNVNGRRPIHCNGIHAFQWELLGSISGILIWVPIKFRKREMGHDIRVSVVDEMIWQRSISWFPLIENDHYVNFILFHHPWCPDITRNYPAGQEADFKQAAVCLRLILAVIRNWLMTL